MDKESRVYIAGHRGMVGSAIWRLLESHGFKHLIGMAHSELDLLNAQAVQDFYSKYKPEYVFLAAAKVGGIGANSAYPAQFIYENLQLQNHIIHQAYLHGVKKLLFLGSSCIYPKMAPQPLKEEYLLTGPLEPSNEWYALAKISGLKMCQAYRRQYGCDFISCMPTNLYGPGDNYHLDNSHVVPALIRKFHEAKTRQDQDVICWGSGKPLREFLHVDDMAKACGHLMERYSEEQTINIGSGKELSIFELAELVKKVVDFKGRVTWDTSKPDGTPRKLLDISRISNLGWKPEIDLEDGLELAYQDFLNRPQTRMK
ncbi:MAG: GDP-L-fucose synthase [Verrucomicrobia bacterium]|nr:GDP-L-fucose synthase [Verrucomicrobiota bacterium]